MLFTCILLSLKRKRNIGHEKKENTRRTAWLLSNLLQTGYQSREHEKLCSCLVFYEEQKRSKVLYSVEIRSEPHLMQQMTEPDSSEGLLQLKMSCSFLLLPHAGSERGIAANSCASQDNVLPGGIMKLIWIHCITIYVWKLICINLSLDWLEFIYICIWNWSLCLGGVLYLNMSTHRNGNECYISHCYTYIIITLTMLIAN